MRTGPGWLYLLWRLCRPPDADPPGLGMAWSEAKRLNATIAHFLLSSEANAKAISARAQQRTKSLDIQATDKQKKGMNEAREYMKRLREHYTGSTEKPNG